MSGRRGRLVPALAVFVALVGLTACSAPDHDELREWMAEVSKNMKGNIPPLPQVKPYEPVPYDAGNVVDPFRPSKIGLEQKKSEGGLRPDMNRPRESLEAFPLESLKFVGVMSRKGASYAIIQADGTLYQVRPGNYMGQNFGVFVRVSEAEVVLKELVQDPVGDWVERESSLQLQSQEARK